ncbi:SDR family oxidoreductase [uncultured Psychromonas sp.]|uniref:SDR family oxidoreductase n=1 Tax=uncultured Psychromonas sp. TaxID=173974 RepID=UPI0026220DD2|nr:SDR family oxidoreductase [uncultured Psychromonas sp.]
MQSKTILITGATSGIGLTLTEKSIEAGYKVIVTGRNQDKLDQIAKDLGVKTYLADSSNLTQLAALGRSLKNDGITLDGVVLNAGVFYPKSFAETTPEDFDEMFAVNNKGPFFTLQALLPSLDNPASVVFISSIGVIKGFPGASTYSASKAAFEATIRVLNMELADNGVRVNIIRPGITATDIHNKAGMTAEQQQGTFDSLKSTPLGRELKPNDHVGAILYLLSDASLALRNTVIDIEGGFLL